MTLKLLQQVIKYSATTYCSCSEEAAQFLFGKQTVESGKAHILKNGIDIRQFTDVDQNSRKNIFQELELPEQYHYNWSCREIFRIKKSNLYFKDFSEFSERG